MIERYVWQSEYYWIQEKKDNMDGNEVKQPNTEAKPIFITSDMLVSEKIERDESEVDIEESASIFPKLTIALIIINVIVFIWELKTGALHGKQEIINAGALYRENFSKGEYWRLGSAMFLHGSIMHIINNMVMLYIMGIIFEKFFSPMKSTLIYLLSGIGGAVVSASFSAGPSVGASGAIFGLIGANMIYIFRNKEIITSINKRVGTVLLAISVITIAEGFMIPYVDNFAHIGGFLAGMFFAYVLKGESVIEINLKNMR